MPYDYQSAIKAGANPDDVLGYLATQNKYDAQSALKAGANKMDVIKYLSTQDSGGGGGFLSGVGGVVGNIAHSIAEPVITLAERPAQLAVDTGKIIGNVASGKNWSDYTPTTFNGFNRNLGIQNDSPQNFGDVLKDVGRGAQTVALGLGGAAGAAEGAIPSLMSSTLTGAGIGALSGAGSSLEQGNQDPVQVLKDTAISSLLGGAVGNVAGRASRFLQGARYASGVTPKVEAALEKAEPGEVEQFIQAAKDRVMSDEAKSPYNLVEDRANQAAEIISKKLKDAGAYVGQVLRSVGNRTIGAAEDGSSQTENLITDFAKQIDERFGHQFNMSPETALSGGHSDLESFLNKGAMSLGDATELIPSEDRAIRLATGDKNRLIAMFDDLQKLHSNPTLRTAKDVLVNLSNDIDWEKFDKFGISHDPLDGIKAHLYGQINGLVREASPELAGANDTFSALKTFETHLSDQFGPDLNRTTLAVRRSLAGDKNAAVDGVLEGIKKLTGVDLKTSSRLAKFAADNFGDEGSQTLFQQAVNQAGPELNAARRFLGGTLARGIGRLVTPNPEAYAPAVEAGRSYSLGRIGDLADRAAGALKGSPFDLSGKVRSLLGGLGGAYAANRVGATPQVLKARQK